MANCTVSGVVKDVSGTAVSGAIITAKLVTSVLSGTDQIVPTTVSTTSDDNGAWSLSLIQGLSVSFLIDYPSSSTSNSRRLQYSGSVPLQSSADFADIAAELLAATSPSLNPLQLTADLDIGSQYGVKSNYYKSRSVNPADAGVVRLANTDRVEWRNLAGTGNLALGPDPSNDNALMFNGAAFPSSASPVFTGTLELISEVGAALFVTAYGTDVNIVQGRYARGTEAAPTAVQAGDTLGIFGGRGYGTTAFALHANAETRILAAENYTDSAQGAHLVVETTPIGSLPASRVERMRVTDAGAVGIGTTTPASYGGSSTLLAAASSTANTNIAVAAASTTPSPVFRGFSANGSLASPTATQSGDSLVVLSGHGYGSTGYSSAGKATIFMNATQTWTDANQGTQMVFGTTPNNSTTRATVLTLDQDKSANFTGQIVSSLSTGTAPLSVSSTTLVPNLYVARSVLADTVTTNANLTGVITSVGNATSIASQTGTGTKFVVDTSPTLVTPNLGTPTTLVGTNITGTASGLTAGNVTTNANLTGVITSVGNATSIASQTGTGTKFVMDNGPTLIAPVLGTPASGVLTNCTGTASGLTAGTVTTNANLTGNVTSVGNATTIAAGVVTNGMLAGSIAASKLVGTDIATVGTLTAGATGAGFTVALSSSTITGTLADARLPSSMATKTFTGVTTFPTSSSIDGSGNAAFGGTVTASGGNILANLSSAAAVTIQVNNNNAGTASQSQFRLQTDSTHAVGSMRMVHVGPSSTPALLTGGPTGEQAVIETDAAFPLCIGTNGTERLRIQADGTMRLGAITATTVPSNATSAMGMYQTGSKYVLWYNDGGTMRYKYLDMSGTGVTWVHTTTAP